MNKILTVVTIVVFFFYLPSVTLASSEFTIDADVFYDIQEKGNTIVTHNITLTNNLSNLYATSYTMKLDGIKPVNVHAYRGNKELVINKTGDNIGQSFEIVLDDAVVGKNNSQKFSITFEEISFAQKSGEVWEVSIPRLSSPDNFRAYTVNLLVPQSFGPKAFISPEPTSKSLKEDKYSYIFEKESVANSGISAGFGNFQVFSFSLSYHLENPLNRSASTEIAIPPDTAFQKVYYQAVDPKPQNVRIDQDGNWLATYQLKPRERLDISVIGAVQIYSEPRNYPEPTYLALENSLKGSDYWQIDDPQIIALSQTYNTAQKIYDFVSQNLSYNYERVRPNVERMGALAALNNPSQAICMEYTDLFIAIARAAGIPAREVNGYAYSENPQIQPLSLVADVLHAWPEYWDKERSAWIPIDPTWGSTTGGVDYFTKLDLRHFAFVHHGENPSTPYSPGSYKLGPNPQKDVFVNFGQLPQTLTSSPKILAETKNNLPFAGLELTVKISNSGPSAFYNLDANILFDGDSVHSEIIEMMPPFSSREIVSKVPFSFLGRNTPSQVEILVSSEKLIVPGFKTQVIILNLAAISLGTLIIVIIIFFKIKHVNISNVLVLIKNFFTKLKKQNGGNKQQIH